MNALCQGSHSFSAAAVDRAGNIDPTPASTAVTVTAGPLCAGPTLEAPKVEDLRRTAIAVSVPVDFKGAGGTVRIEWGPTTAYGTQLSYPLVSESPGPIYFELRQLTPDTQYHYRITATTPFGSAATPDQTVTSKALEGTTIPVPQFAPGRLSPHSAELRRDG